MKKVFLLDLSLQGISPKIWRKILVPRDYSFFDLHQVIQKAMGWETIHSHIFFVRDRFVVEDIGELPEGEEEQYDEKTTSLKSLLQGPGTEFFYLYDTTDKWMHTIRVEELTEVKEEEKIPTCLSGERASPPEDFGGSEEYQHFVEILKDPSHPERKEFEGLPLAAYDPEDFDLEFTNDRIDSLKGNRWVGGMIDPFSEAKLDEDLPSIVIWFDPINGTVIGQAPRTSEQWQKTALELLREALEEVKNGYLEAPAVLKVKDLRLADLIKTSIGDTEFELSISETKELDALSDALLDEFSDALSEDDVALPDLSDVSIGDMKKLFESSAKLYRTRPWAHLSENDFITLECIELDLAVAVLAADGSSKDEFSLNVFSSMEDYLLFLTTIGEQPPDSDELPPPGVPLRSLHFERGASIPADTRRFISHNNFEVADSQAYPILTSVKPNGNIGAPKSEDFRLFSLCCESLIELVDELKEQKHASECSRDLVIGGIAETDLHATIKLGPYPWVDEFGDAFGDEFDGVEFSYSIDGGPSHPEFWLDIDDSERIEMIEESHREAKEHHDEIDEEQAHLSFHLMVENQLASRELPMVEKTLARLMNDGLSRHDAIHAIGSVLAAEIHKMMETQKEFSQRRYEKQLSELTIKKWHERCEIEEEHQKKPSKSRKSSRKRSNRKKKRR